MTIFRLRTLMRRHGLAASIAAAAGLSIGAPALAQDLYDEHYEWEADEGVHEEEWYDPSDWWDDDYYESEVDYESDWYEMGWGEDNEYQPYEYGDAYDREPDWDDMEYYDAEPDGDYYGYGMYRYDYGWDDEYAEGYDDAFGWDYGAQAYEDGPGYGFTGGARAGYDRFDYEFQEDREYMTDPRYQRYRENQRAQRDRGMGGEMDRRMAPRGDRAGMRNVQLRGEIEDWKRVQLRGQRDAHTFVRLELEDGEEAVVNLGPNVSLSRLDLEEDDDIIVFGPMGQVNGRDVVMARGVRVEGRTVRMNEWSANRMSGQMEGEPPRRMQDQRPRRGADEMYARRNPGQMAQRDRERMQREQRQRDAQGERAQRDRQRQADIREQWSMSSSGADRQGERRAQRDRQRPQGQSDQRRAQRSAELRGELSGWSRVTLEGHTDSHTLVRMKLDDGRNAIVDLGPNVSLSRLDLSEGNRVAVYGPVGSINDRDVVMAQKIRVAGQTISMNNWSPESHQRDVSQARSDRGDRAGQQRSAMASERRGERGARETQRASGAYAMYSQQREQRQSQGESGRASGDQGVQQGEDRNQRRVVERVISEWPEASKRAARSMLEEYGLPSGITPAMLVWQNNGPFVKTMVHRHTVQHNFPTPHQDVLHQFVNLEVPADRLDELAKFNGSIVTYPTDGLVSARCHSEAMNILALNLASQVIEGEKTPSEARRELAQTARAYAEGERPRMTQRLAFDTRSRNTDRFDSADQRSGGQRTSMR